MSFVEAIARKRDGLALSHADIKSLVEGASRGTIAVEQLSAMLMAICCRGMSSSETAMLTEEMLRSGETWRLAEQSPAAIDKHSTGGVGDTVSLILAPLLAAVGVPVAMMAGRGLGHSQGTLDKLEAIPGFIVEHERDGMLALIDRCGAAIVAQSEQIAPADRTLYALRDVTGTVPSLPLIVGSIMSKKMALGAGTLVLDVKWGSGAFRKTVPQAVELASALRQVARDFGMVCEALITDMNQPLASALGTACEVRAALAVLADGGDQRLREVTLALCEQAMVLRGQLRHEARAKLEKALADGSATAAWQSLVTAHGGDPDATLPTPEQEIPVLAEQTGYLSAVAAEDLGWLTVELGAGRRHRAEPLAHGAGLLIHGRIGDKVEAGSPLATLLIGERPVDLDACLTRTRNAFTIAEHGPQPQPPILVLGTVDEAAARPTEDH